MKFTFEGLGEIKKGKIQKEGFKGYKEGGNISKEITTYLYSLD
jgi:hypothetical protein